MARTCNKHPGTQFVVIESKPSRKGGAGVTYAGCPKCRAERERGGLPPTPGPAKAASKKSAKKTPAKKAPEKSVIPPEKQEKTEGSFARFGRLLGLR
jgi:hypothetical protein